MLIYLSILLTAFPCSSYYIHLKKNLDLQNKAKPVFFFIFKLFLKEASRGQSMMGFVIAAMLTKPTLH